MRSKYATSELCNSPYKTIFFQVDIPVGKQFGISARLVAELDTKFHDFQSYWQKLKQLSPVSAISLSVLPSSVKRSSVKLVYNPAESESKEISISFNVGTLTLVATLLF